MKKPSYFVKNYDHITKYKYCVKNSASYSLSDIQHIRVYLRNKE